MQGILVEFDKMRKYIDDLEKKVNDKSIESKFMKDVKSLVDKLDEYCGRVQDSIELFAEKNSHSEIGINKLKIKIKLQTWK